MSLWVDGKPGSPGIAIRAKVRDQVTVVNRQVTSRAVRAVNIMRTHELRVLKGKRNGYNKSRKPGTKATYVASAPGEPPARRTGNLRMHWNPQVKTKGVMGGGTAIVAALESQERYASYLENGTERMEPRPFADRIKEEAFPEIEKLYKEPYI